MRLWALLAASMLACPAAARDAEPPARACPRHGPGFVEVPGTATCIRIAGRVTAGYGMAGRRRIARDDIAGLGASGRLSADVRMNTAYGPMRAFVRMRAGQDSAER